MDSPPSDTDSCPMTTQRSAPRGRRDDPARAARLAADLAIYCRETDAALRGRRSRLAGRLPEAVASIEAELARAAALRGEDRLRSVRRAQRAAGECRQLVRALDRNGHLDPDRARQGLRLILVLRTELLRLIRILR
jgi:hypothetical protein